MFLQGSNALLFQQYHLKLVCMQYNINSSPGLKANHVLYFEFIFLIKDTNESCSWILFEEYSVLVYNITYIIHGWYSICSIIIVWINALTHINYINNLFVLNVYIYLISANTIFNGFILFNDNNI